MPDASTALLLLVIALLGAILYYVGREIWRGVREAKREFDSRKGSEPESEAEPDPEEPRASAQRGGRTWEPRPWHEVLGVPPTASLLEIKTAYRQSITRYHPDRVAGLGDELRELAERHAKEINEAYVLACKLRA